MNRTSATAHQSRLLLRDARSARCTGDTSSTPPSLSKSLHPRSSTNFSTRPSASPHESPPSRPNSHFQEDPDPPEPRASLPADLEKALFTVGNKDFHQGKQATLDEAKKALDAATAAVTTNLPI